MNRPGGATHRARGGSLMFGTYLGFPLPSRKVRLPQRP